MRKTRQSVTYIFNAKESLKWWNIAVVFVHWSSFIALMIIYLLRDNVRHVSLWVDNDVGTFIKQLGSYPLFATLVPFPFLTGCFHIAAALGADNYYNGVLKQGVNRLRWIEYSITNGLMTWSLCLVVGGGSVVVPVLCVFANFSMQTYGWWHEMRNHHPSLLVIKRSMTPLLLGFVPWVATWATLFTYYGLNYNALSTADSFAVIGSFLWSLLFVAPLLWRFTKASTQRNNYLMERAYILLSLTAKLWLDWTLTIGELS